MKRYIKKHLLTWVVKALFLFAWYGLYVNVNSYANAQRGYTALGIEDILYMLPLIISAFRTFKKIITERNYLT